MPSEPIISVSGLRGIVGESLDPALAARFVASYVAECEPGPIIVTRDGRSTGCMLMQAVMSGLMAAGRNVLDGGIASTPTLGVLVKQHEAAGGVQISASHNPPEYNGIKLFSEEGRVLSAKAGEKVLARFRAGDYPWTDYTKIGTHQALTDTIHHHLELVLATVDVEAIRKRTFRVLLDSNHGAGSILGDALLKALHCDAILVGDHADGHFEHPPEPTETNLKSISAKVVEAGVDVAFCQDPDADRLAIIDGNGSYIGEEYTVALTVLHALETGRGGPIVTNCATSRMAEALAKQHGAEFSRSAVGEANVTDEMHRIKAAYGGEGNGGPIDPKVGYVRDSFVGMAQVLDLMAKRGQPLAEIVKEIPRFEIRKSQVSISGLDVQEILSKLEAKFSETTSSRQDGLRLDWPDGRWLLVRASNTEPIVRLIAEANSGDEAEALIAEASSAINS